jgi:hypothetical protein
MEVVEKDIQERILESVKSRLSKEDKLSQVLMDTLFLSQDAVYRRIRGDVPLTIFETKTLCETFNISFDEFGTYRKGQVNFLYNPLKEISLNFRNYMIGIRDGMETLKKLDNVEMIMSVNDTQLFQLFNLPHLTRFKYFFWGKTYLKMPQYVNKKFAREKIDREVLGIGIEAHNIYNSLTTHEIYGPETLRGTLRQIEYYFDAHLFEDPSYALELLDNVSELIVHMERQAEIGIKFPRGNRPPEIEKNFFMYSNDIFIADSTILIKWEQGSAVYLTHNIMNFLYTTDPYYTAESISILDKLIENSSLISDGSLKERSRFFGNIERSVQNLRRKIENDLEM